MRNPNTQVSPVDLSHNESTRLAMDALLDKGLDGYQEVLIKENEANFLSAEEKTYILNNIKKPLNDDEEADRDEEVSSSPSVSSETYFPAATESEPRFLTTAGRWLTGVTICKGSLVWKCSSSQ